MSTRLQANGLRVTVVGNAASVNLEGSFGRGLESLGCDVDYFDLAAAISRHTRLQPVGRLLHRYFPVESWVRKGNRELALKVVDTRQQMLVVVGTTPVRVGALAQIKQTHPETSLVMVWPDPLLSLDSYVTEALCMYDVVAACSRESISVFEQLGARNVVWVPFASDFSVHPRDIDVSSEERARYSCEVIFIGGHRPEREQAMLSLLDAGVDVKVWGPPAQWRNNATRLDRLGDYFQNEPLRGHDFAKATRCAKLALNMMDPGNYPGCNMRFFENFTTGTATVNSPCPELDDVFVHRESTVYCTPEKLVTTVRDLLEDAPLRVRLAENAVALVDGGHTYRARACTLLSSLGIDS